MAPRIFAEQTQHFYLTKERASAQGFIDLICLGLSTAIFRDFPETQSAFVAIERLQTACPQSDVSFQNFVQFENHPSSRRFSMCPLRTQAGPLVLTAKPRTLIFKPYSCISGLQHGRISRSAALIDGADVFTGVGETD
jgi:hypothetical protein